MGLLPRRKIIGSRKKWMIILGALAWTLTCNWPNSAALFSDDQNSFCSTKLLFNTLTKWDGRKHERWIRSYSVGEFNNMFNSRTFTNFLDHYNSVLQTSNLRHSRGNRIIGPLEAGRTGLLLSSLTNSEILRKNFLKRNFASTVVTLGGMPFSLFILAFWGWADIFQILKR